MIAEKHKLFFSLFSSNIMRQGQLEDKEVFGGLCIQAWAKADQLLVLRTQGMQDVAPLFIVLTVVEQGACM